MPGVRASDQFHVGVVVDDLEAALAELGTLFGYSWCDEMHVEQVPVHLPPGDAMVDFRFRYSRSTPRLELIQSQPGTLWTPAAGSGVHHLGYWCDDVVGDGAALERSGYALEAAGRDADGNRSWAYHRSAAGPRIELVSRTLEPMLSLMWAG